MTNCHVAVAGINCVYSPISHKIVSFSCHMLNASFLQYGIGETLFLDNSMAMLIHVMN